MLCNREFQLSVEYHTPTASNGTYSQPVDKRYRTEAERTSEGSNLLLCLLCPATLPVFLLPTRLQLQLAQSG